MKFCFILILSLCFSELEILHFSDAYNIEESSEWWSEKMKYASYGGAARFKRAFDLYRSKDKLVFFSGDLFFPSKCKLPIDFNN